MRKSAAMVAAVGGSLDCRGIHLERQPSGCLPHLAGANYLGRGTVERRVKTLHRVEEAVPFRTQFAQAAARVRADFSFAMIDAVLVVIAYTAALVLRFIDIRGVPEDWWQGFASVLLVIVVVHLGANLVFGAYGHVWEFASIQEAMRLVLANLAAAAVLLGGIVTYRTVSGEVGPVPLTAMAVGAMVALGGMGLVRFRSRLFSFKRMSDAAEPVRTLVVGTGRAAADLARRGATEDRPRIVVAFISATETPGPRRLAGRPVLSSINALPELVDRLRIQEVVVADPVDDYELRRLVDSCMEIDVRLRILPDIRDVLGNDGLLRDVRDMQLEDLLPRPAVSLDMAQVRELIEGKRVLVTGAGGSIGSEVVRQVLHMAPERVQALDHDETLLHDAMLSWSAPDVVAPALCDVRDRLTLLREVGSFQPDIVFHACALKHVPLLEAHPAEAIKTNVLGTRNVLDAFRVSDGSQFVLISTDKAVEPSSVLGASKRVAEMLVQSVADADPTKVYATVRFGNVLGSRGSVVPTFARQIREGGPVTITDPTMTRYFMTVGEAVALVLQASALAEKGEVFVLDMGEPMRIDQLAKRMIRLAGLVPERDIEVVVIGRRPGEKQTELLSIEPLMPSSNDRINIAVASYPKPATLLNAMAMLERDAEAGDADDLRSLLHDVAWQNWRSEEVVDLRGLEDVTLWT